MKSLLNVFILFFIFLISLNSFAQYQAGRDYERISSPLAVKQDGKVEVIEAFWYGCGHCYSFEPVINKWKKELNDDVKFAKLPVGWGPMHQLHATLYYTIEALKIGETGHGAVFTAIHKEGNYLSSEKSILEFLSKLGISKQEAYKQMNSFSVKQKVKRSIELSRKLKVSAVPMMFVDGKYKIQVKGSTSKMLDTVDYLVNIEKPNS